MSFTAVAHAQDPQENAELDMTEQEALTLFQLGVEALDAENWTRARQLLWRSLQIVPRASTRYNYALACWRGGAIREATLQLESLLDEELPSEQLEATIDLLEDVRADMSSIAVRIEGVEAAEIMLDGEARGRASPNLLLEADPGQHRVAARIEEQQVAFADIVTLRGERQALELVVTNVPVPDDSGQGSESSDQSALVAGLATGGALAVIIAVSITLAIVLSGDGRSPPNDPLTGVAVLQP